MMGHSAVRKDTVFTWLLGILPSLLHTDPLNFEEVVGSAFVIKYCYSAVS